MDNLTPLYLFCTYCQVGAHEVVTFQAIYEYLDSLATTAEPNQGRSSGTKEACHRVAHWGQAKRRSAYGNSLAVSDINGASYGYGPAAYLAAPDVSTQGFHHSWYHPTDLSYDEV